MLEGWTREIHLARFIPDRPLSDVCLLGDKPIWIGRRPVSGRLRRERTFLPTVPPGSACPVTPGHPADTFSPFGSGNAAGAGSVYALLGGPNNGVVGFGGPVEGWYGRKGSVDARSECRQ